MITLHYRIFVISLIAAPITTSCDCKSFTVSYGDSCFGVFEFHQILFWGYHLWRGTDIRKKCFTVIVFVWYFYNRHFVDYYILCEVVCRLVVALCILVVIMFVLIGIFAIIAFIIIIFVLFVFLIFVPWLYCDSVSWHVRVCHSNKILAHLHLLNARTTLNCDPISRKSCRYPCIGILCKGCFIFSWHFCYLLFIHSFSFQQKLVTNNINS